DEGIPKKEPRFDDEEADIQRAVEESLNSVHDIPRGPLLPVVIREPDSGKFQPLPEVQGKGKKKVSDEQVALDLLTLQTPKKKSLDEQYIFQRHTRAPTKPSGPAESSSIYAALGLTDSALESDKEVSHVVKVEAQDEGHAGPNPGVPTEGHAGSDLGDDAEPQPQSSHVVHAGPNLEHIDLEATDVSTQLHPEQMDERFTAPGYPNVQENLKLTVEEQVILEEPASSTGTLSSLQHLAKDFSFGDLFFNDKPSEAENEKTTAETEAQSMVSVTIQQDTSTIPPMTTPVIDLTSRPNSPNVHRPLQAVATETTTTTTTHPPPPQPQQSTTDSMLIKRISELEQIIVNLIQDNKHLKERLDSHGEGQSHGSTVLSSSKTAASAEYTAWTTTNTRLNPFVSSIPKDLHMDDDMAPDAQAHSSDDKDIGNAYIPKVNLQQDWWKPLEEDRPATPEPAWSIPSFDMPVPTNNWASALAFTYTPLPEDSLLVQTGPVFKLVKVFHPNVIHLQYQMEECHKLLTDSVDESIIRHNVSKPLLLGGLPSQVTIQSNFFFNKDLEYLRYGRKGGRPALSISKMKAAYYPDVGLEQMVPDQMWIDEECKHTSEGDRRAVRTYMRILSVVRIEVFSLYGSPEPSTTQRQEDSYYCSQLIDQTLGYQAKHRRLPVGDLKLPDLAQPHQTSMGCHGL
nr:hypothetical protein [Tanacetum cinerariifolium]